MKKLLQRRAARWMVFILLFFVAVFFLPTVVVSTPLAGMVIRSLTRDLNGSVNVGSISAGWFSPVTLTNVRVVDDAGAELASVESVRTGKSLWSIWQQPGGWPNVALEGFHAHIKVRKGGSNVEDVVAKLLAKPSQPGSLSLQLTATGSAKISNGEGASIQLAATELTVKMKDGVKQFRLKSKLDHAPNSAISFALQKRGDAQDPYQAELETTRLPLQLMETMLARFGLHWQCTGDVSGTCKFAGSLKKQQWQWSQLTGRNVRVLAARHGHEPLVLTAFRSEGRAELSEQGLWIADARFSSELTELAIRGGVRVPTSGEFDPMWVVNENYDVQGSLNLARLAAVFPRALAIRQGTHLRAGNVKFALRSVEEQRQRVVDWAVTTDLIEADHRGQVYRWKQPLTMRLKARQSRSARNPLQLSIDELNCRSAFANVTLTGTQRHGELSAQIALDRLREDIQHIVDLSRIQLAGRMTLGARWHLDQSGRWFVRGNMQPSRGKSMVARVENMKLKLPGWQLWEEPNLRVSLAAQATPGKGNTNWRFEQCELGLEGREDTVELSLLDPLQVPKLDAVALRCRFRGRLDPWRARLQLFSQAEIHPTGSADIEADIHWAKDVLELKSMRGQLSQFALKTRSLNIQERLIKLTGSGRWHPAAKELWVGRATVASSALSLATERFRWQYGSARLDGRVGFRAQLARLQSWFPRVGPEWPRFTGQASGQLRWQVLKGETAFDGITEIANLVLESSHAKRVRHEGRHANVEENVLWREPRLRMKLKGAVAMRGHPLRLDQLDVDGERVQLRTTGGLQQLGGQKEITLKGRIAYDLRQWKNELTRYLGSEIRLSGAQTRDFNVRGLLPTSGPSTWEGSFSLGWDKAYVYGIDLQSSVLRATLDGERIALQPAQIPVSGGKLFLAGHLPLNVQPSALVMKRGPLVSRVDITEQMCRTWLKYVTPMVANATRVSGSLSVDLTNQPTIQFANAGASHIAGQLRIHRAKIGPAPMTDLAIWIARQAKAIATRQPLKLLGTNASTWVVMPEQETAFTSKDGRVTHQRLRFLIGDVEVQTSGSVGLDQSLKMVASVPIKDEWRRKSQALQRYPGKTIELPIRGSLRKPRTDKKALLRLGVQLAPGALENLLDKQLKRGLERLFK